VGGDRYRYPEAPVLEFPDQFRFCRANVNQVNSINLVNILLKLLLFVYLHANFVVAHNIFSAVLGAVHRRSKNRCTHQKAFQSTFNQAYHGSHR
jgi:hypothetical protein